MRVQRRMGKKMEGRIRRGKEVWEQGSMEDGSKDVGEYRSEDKGKGKGGGSDGY